MIENGIDFSIREIVVSKTQPGVTTNSQNTKTIEKEIIPGEYVSSVIYDYNSEKPFKPTVMSLDIDWNGAVLATSTYNGNVTETTTINKTSELLNYIQNKVNTSDFVNLLQDALANIEQPHSNELPVNVYKDPDTQTNKLYIGNWWYGYVGIKNPNEFDISDELRPYDYSTNFSMSFSDIFKRNTIIYVLVKSDYYKGCAAEFTLSDNPIVTPIMDENLSSGQDSAHIHDDNIQWNIDQSYKIIRIDLEDYEDSLTDGNDDIIKVTINIMN